MYEMDGYVIIIRRMSSGSFVAHDATNISKQVFKDWTQEKVYNPLGIHKL